MLNALLPIESTSVQSNPPPEQSRLAILMPAKDEAAAIGQVVESVRSNFPEAVLIVIDDGSVDTTAEMAEFAGANVLRLPIALGAWGAIQAGMRYALRLKCDTVVTMDADGQHLADEIPALLEAMERDRAAVVIGAYPERGSRARRFAWRFFRVLSGFSFADLTSGFRAYNREALWCLASPRATMLEFQDIGVLLLMRSQGLTIAEIPVSMRKRLAGKSRVFSSWWKVGGYLFQTVLLCLAGNSLRWKNPKK